MRRRAKWYSGLAAMAVVAIGCDSEQPARRDDAGVAAGQQVALSKDRDDIWGFVAKAESDAGGVHVVVHSDTLPIPVNAMHRWRVQVLRGSDEPTPFMPEALVVNGGMPSHGHGLPTQPAVSRYLGDGTFLVDGMRFNMGGEWQMIVRVLEGNRWHRAVFTITLQSAGNAVHHGSTWNATEMGLLRSLSLSAAGERPRDRTNRVQNDARAVELGRALFFDARLSANGEVSCATCHQESLAFTDGRKTGKGLAVLDRNTPSIVGAVWQRWFYWDGRRDSLWAQALVPIEAAGEMGSSRLAVVRVIRGDPEYKRAYEDLFGTLPRLEGVSMLQASPVGPESHRAAWRKVPVQTRRSVNLAFANVGKAIAAFESTLDFQQTRFDRYVDAGAKNGLLSDAEVDGLRLFIDPKNQCMKCHNGPMFTNGGFHNIGTGSSDPASLDVGRIAGLQAALLDEFNCRGRYSDDRERCAELEHLAPEAHLAGAFKVPSIRGAAKTPPYMHDGRFSTLREVLEFYRTPPAQSNPMRHELVPLPHLTDSDLDRLEAFIRVLGE